MGQKKKKVRIQKSRRNLRVQEQDEEEFTVVKGSCSVAKPCLTLCDPTGYSTTDFPTTDFPLLHQHLEFAQTH